MKESHPIILTPKGTEYTVFIPDFNAISRGNDLIEALEKACDTIGSIGASMIAEGTLLPKPNANKAIDPKPMDIITVVNIDFDNYIIKKHETTEVSCQIPVWLYSEAKKEKIDFSQVLQEALVKKLSDK